MANRMASSSSPQAAKREAPGNMGSKEKKAKSSSSSSPDMWWTAFALMLVQTYSNNKSKKIFVLFLWESVHFKRSFLGRQRRDPLLQGVRAGLGLLGRDPLWQDGLLVHQQDILLRRSPAPGEDAHRGGGVRRGYTGLKNLFRHFFKKHF